MTTSRKSSLDHESCVGRARKLALAAAGLVYLMAGGPLDSAIGAAPDITSRSDDVIDQGSSEIFPWSGYWWPHQEGAMLGPLASYDHLTGASAVTWEKGHHAAGDDTPDWFGYCHAWAASSVLEPEPTAGRMARFQQRTKQLPVGDQKGLLAVSHALDVANTYGDRFGDGVGSDELQDLTPDSLWRLLKLYVKQQRVPLILDVEATEEVWNYPVYAYRIVQTGERENGVRTAELGIWMADNSVTPNHVGLKPKFLSYTFRFRMRNGSVVMGSGRWIGRSVQDHPDFAWYPYIARPENPEVKYPIVRELLGRDRDADEPSNPDPPENSSPENGLVTIAESDADALLIGPAQLAALVATRVSNFSLDADADPFGVRRYERGDAIRLRIASERDGFVYLLHVSPAGELTQLFPQPGIYNRITAGGTLVLPNRNFEFDLRAIAPGGTHRIKAIVTTRRLRLSGLLADFGPSQQTETTQSGNETVPESNSPKPARAGSSSRALYIKFRWHPTQRQQLQQLLRQSFGQNDGIPKELNSIDLQRLLGDFAQDEVTYHVGADGAAVPHRK